MITGGDVFEDNFTQCLSTRASVASAVHCDWLDQLFGPPEAACPNSEVDARFSSLTADVDYLCPNYELNALAPHLMHLRNRCGAPVRLLLIAHSPGVGVLDWVLLSMVMVPGDIIVAPSHSAARMIDFLCPGLSPHVRVIPHPMPPLQPPNGSRRTSGRPRLINLSRIYPDKLMHRQIEAFDILRKDGFPLPVLEIAGPLRSRGAEDEHPYARSLRAKIRRLELDDSIRLVGPITDLREKAAWIAGSDLLINLSVSVEESFGKSVVEALALGIPVLGTNWDGLPETIGEAGRLVEVKLSPDTMPDVEAVDVADAIRRVLTDPPSAATCLRQARRSSTETIADAYDQAMREGLAKRKSAAPFPDPLARKGQPPATSGFCAQLVALRAYTQDSLFQMHLDNLPFFRRGLRGKFQESDSEELRLRVLLFSGALHPLACVQTDRMDLIKRGSEFDIQAFVPTEGRSIERRLRERALDDGDPCSRVSCLQVLLQFGDEEVVAEALDKLKSEGVYGPGVRHLCAELALRRGDLPEALDICQKRLDGSDPRESDAAAIRQLARIYRKLQRPADALPWLRSWLARFPDAPDSGSVWLAASVNAYYAGRRHVEDARQFLARAETLLGPSAVIDKVKRMLSHAGDRVSVN